MSTSSTVYVGYGVMLPFRSLNEMIMEGHSELEPYVDKKQHKGLSIICDGMNGQYTFVGHIVAQTDAEGDMMHTEFGSNSITVRASRQAGEPFIVALLKLVGQMFPEIKPSDLSVIWHTWSHYE